MSGFIVIHGNHMEDLRDVVVARISTHPLAPLQSETFLVQSNGMAQWLRLALADEAALGISAAIRFELPASFLWRVCQTVLDRETLAQSPFEKAQLGWRLMRLLPQVIADDPSAFAPITHYLADDHDGYRRWQLARRLADLFDQYQIYRPDWLDIWSESGTTADGIEAQAPWQPALWRALIADVPVEHRDERRDRVFASFIQALRERPAEDLVPLLPQRLYVFGLSALPPSQLEVLVELGRVCEVMLLLLNPCQYFWGDTVDPSEAAKRGLRHARHQRKPGQPAVMDESSLHLHANPLLAAWGRQGRDFIDLLHGYDQPEDYRGSFDQIDLFRDRAGGGVSTCLLRSLQQGVLELTPTPSDPHERQPLDNDDRSLVFQSAYGPLREVEMLHDHLLHTFEGQPDLEPRDIIVMVPDVATYAPLFEAVFGSHSQDDERRIPYSIADRPTRGSTALFGAIEQLLTLPENRLTATEVLDLLEVPAFRARFDIDATELPTLLRWIDGAGIRWGLDSAHRQSFDLPDGRENTWASGLERMLLGYAAGDAPPWNGVLPYPEVAGLEADLAGRLVQVMEFLAKTSQQLNQSTTPRQWVQRLREMIAASLLPTDNSEHHHLNMLDQVLVDWQAACDIAALDEPLTLRVVREALWDGVDAHGGTQRFLAGRVNIGTLMPMRAIPFRIVCLLGMNDGDYPRQQPQPDFDLMAQRPRPGDRSRREDDRYLFLEALLSARDQLYISYCGRDPRDDSKRAPSVLVGQLRDTIAAGWYPQDYSADDPEAGAKLLAHLTTEHPLQPFSRRYFEASTLPPTFAREWALPQEAAPATAQPPLPAPEPPETPLGFSHLKRLLREPVEVFFQQRLGVWLHDEELTLADEEPFASDALEHHQQITTIVTTAIAEQRPAAVIAGHMRLAGALPHAAFGELALESITATAETLLERYRDTTDNTWLREPLEIEHTTSVAAGVTLRLTDWIDDLRDSRDAIIRVIPHAGKYGSSGKKIHYWLSAWPVHLAACAKGWDITTYLVCCDRLLSLPPLPQSRAHYLLSELLRAWWAAQMMPLPVAREPALKGYMPKRLPISCRQLTGEIGALPDALTAAETRYERPDGDGRDAPVVANRHLARAYPRFTDMAAEFSTWTEYLYQPLWQAVHGDSEGKITP